MTTIYIVRHAEAEGNVKRLFQGHYDGAISPLGERQLAFLSERFAKIHLDAVYASPLSRTRQTAQAINAHAGLPICCDRDLMEICGGQFEGRLFRELPRLFPEAFSQWENDPAHFTAPGGESMRQVYDRMSAAIGRIAAAHPAQTVAVASHGCAIRCYQCYALGLPLERIGELAFGQNTCVSRVDYDDSLLPHVVFLNDISHLPPSLVKQPAFGRS